MPCKITKTPGQVGRSSGEPAATHRQAHAALLALANPNKAAFLTGFFKTGKGQFAERDRFLGIAVPAIRQLARQFQQLDLTDCERLLQSADN
jgi:DNA alkylation repair enzyme